MTIRPHFLSPAEAIERIDAGNVDDLWVQLTAILRSLDLPTAEAMVLDLNDPRFQSRWYGEQSPAEARPDPDLIGVNLGGVIEWLIDHGFSPTIARPSRETVH